jgi:hypothetical protein
MSIILANNMEKSIELIKSEMETTFIEYLEMIKRKPYEPWGSRTYGTSAVNIANFYGMINTFIAVKTEGMGTDERYNIKQGLAELIKKYTLIFEEYNDGLKESYKVAIE